jgi:hypothetical protein
VIKTGRRQMLELEKLINDFWQYVRDEKVELYNEFSLQHELGIFLRNVLDGYLVQFERNVSFFGIFGNTTIKKEMRNLRRKERPRLTLMLSNKIDDIIMVSICIILC